MKINIKHQEITAFITTAIILAGNIANDKANVVYLGYIKAYPIVFILKLISKAPKTKEIISFIKSFPLKYENATPGINPQSPVPKPIIGLYGPFGAIIPPIRSPIKHTKKAFPAPNKYPATKPMVATKDN